MPSQDIIELLPDFREKPIPSGAFSLKLILVGNAGVGKTSLAYRFVEGLMPTDYIPTLGVNILRKEEKLRPDTDFNWLIWDVGGQAMMENVRKRFYSGTVAALLVLDKTSRESLKALESRWLREMGAAKVHVEDIPVVVIANKVDLQDQIEVPTEDVRDFAAKHKFHFIETSALTGENVLEAFEFLAYEYFTRLKE
ncbi:MAG TPA: Rab family GTPase [Candidatus Lokiarchaeia archaeon]|nr:Rab family GTPase [Candidatus Lokiarchaeia archaeon]